MNQWVFEEFKNFRKPKQPPLHDSRKISYCDTTIGENTLLPTLWAFTKN